MATHKSAEKRHRQSLKRRQINRANRSALRTQVKKLRSSVSESDRDTAQKLMIETTSLIDRSAKKGLLHRNAAARQKSRLARLVNTLATGGASKKK